MNVSPLHTSRSSGLRAGWVAAGMLTLALLTACASGSDKFKPAELPPVAALMGTRLAWSTQVGASHASLQPHTAAGRVFVAGSAGTVAAIDAATGKDIWRLDLNTPIAAGVGADGQVAAVVTLNNDLVAMANGRELWRVRLPARSFTAPLVAGERVFVLTADRTVRAFDGQNGTRLWAQARTAEPLVLNQPSALIAVGDTLVAGLSGRLAGLNPGNGSIRWEAPIGNARGTNEVERLVDIVGPVSRMGNSVCARAYSAAVGCVNALNGLVDWSKSAQGTTGVHGDATLVFGSEADGRLVAWRRDTGEQAWAIDRLKHRELSAPLAVGRVLAVGDGLGLLHLLSREDGSELTRMNPDGSAILATPVIADGSVVVQTRNGGVFAWRPQ